jgi:SAM-dependent methyltransferase
VGELQERRTRISRVSSAWWRSAVKVKAFCAGKLYGAQPRLFDLLLGVSTKGTTVTGGPLFYAGGDNCYYEGCAGSALRRALRDLNPTASDVFVDLGSGKGKALLIAGRLPYKRVVGVEIDEELARLAERNLDRTRLPLRAGRVECLTGSVLEWPFPDDASVIFMFNPFIGQTFSTVMSKILESYDRNPRILHIVYEHPWEHDKLLSTGRVVVDNVRSRPWPALGRWWESGNVIVTYRVVDSVACDGLERRGQHRALRPRRAVEHWSMPSEHNFSMPIPGSTRSYTKLPS